MKLPIWLALCLPALAAAQDIGRPATLGDPSVPSTHSVEQAENRLAQVKREREAAETVFAASERACYDKFFVNACIDNAKEHRRVRLAALRAIEVEASYFKRRHAVELRDMDLEERARKDAAEAAYLAAQPKPPKPEPEDKPLPQPAAKSLEQRQAEHDARERARAAREAAEAPQRAAKAAAFARKQEEAAQRQANVAARLAEKQAKQRQREEAAAQQK